MNRFVCFYLDHVRYIIPIDNIKDLFNILEIKDNFIFHLSNIYNISFSNENFDNSIIELNKNVINNEDRYSLLFSKTCDLLPKNKTVYIYKYSSPNIECFMNINLNKYNGNLTKNNCTFNKNYLLNKFIFNESESYEIYLKNVEMIASHLKCLKLKISDPCLKDYISCFIKMYNINKLLSEKQIIKLKV